MDKPIKIIFVLVNILLYTFLPGTCQPILRHVIGRSGTGGLSLYCCHRPHRSYACTALYALLRGNALTAARV